MNNLPAPFDYQRFDQSTQSVLRTHAHRIGELSRQVSVDLWEMGKVLTDAQRQLAAHGTGVFLAWLEQEAGLPRSTAYRLINVYRTFDVPSLGKMPLGATVLYALSEPSTPPQARQEVLARAQRGEVITERTAREIIEDYTPRPAPRGEREPPPLPEYVAFEREQLMPQLTDAGLAAAPQILSGPDVEIKRLSDEERQEIEQTLRAAIIEQLVAYREGKDIEECADELIEIMGQSSGSIAASACIGVTLAGGPQTLMNLTAVVVRSCGEYVGDLERDAYLRWRKRTLRLVDSISYAGGPGIYQHKLTNKQIVIGLLRDEEIDA